MLSADDLTQMQADAVIIRDDNDVSITIRRGSTTLAAQTVRLELLGAGRGQRVDAGPTQEYRSHVIVFGAPALNIQVEDRFTASGVLYRVIEVSPNRQAATQAQAERVE